MNSQSSVDVASASSMATGGQNSHAKKKASTNDPECRIDYVVSMDPTSITSKNERINMANSFL